MANRWWMYAPPGYKLRSDIEKKKRKLLLPGIEDDFHPPDFAAEEQAGLTALWQTPKTLPGQNAVMRAAPAPPLRSRIQTQVPETTWEQEEAEALAMRPPPKLPYGASLGDKLYGEFPVKTALRGLGETALGSLKSILPDEPLFRKKALVSYVEKLAERAGRDVEALKELTDIQTATASSPEWQSALEALNIATVGSAGLVTKGFGQAAVEAARASRMVLPGAIAKGAKTVAPILREETGGIKIPEGTGKGKTPKKELLEKLNSNITQNERNSLANANITNLTEEEYIKNARLGGYASKKAYEKHVKELRNTYAEAAKPLPGQAPLEQAGKEAKQPWEMTQAEFIASNKTEKAVKFTVKSQHPQPYGAVEVDFVPRRTKDGSQVVKAVARQMNGKEYPASSSDISDVTGKEFFQGETRTIGYERLRAWLKGSLTTEQAANEGRKDIAYAQTHYDLINAALDEDKPVSPKVLAEYPDLAAKAKPLPGQTPLTSGTVPRKIYGVNETKNFPATFVNDLAVVRNEIRPGFGTDITGKTAGWIVTDKNGKTIKGGFDSKREAMEFALAQAGKEAKQPTELFIRPLKVSEKANPSSTSNMSKIPDKEGYEKVYKPYGEKGRGYYYQVKPAETLAPKPAAETGIAAGQAGAKRITYNKASMGDAVRAAKALKSPDNLYIYPTTEGFQIAKEPPPFGAQHVIIKPDGTHQIVSRGTSFEAGRQAGVEPLGTGQLPKALTDAETGLTVSAPELVPPTKVAQGEAAIPPSKPPAVTGQPDIDDEYQIVAGWLRDPKRVDVRNEMDQAWKPIRAKRFAAYQNLNQSYLNEGATAEEAQRLAKSAMKGKLGDPDSVMSDDISRIFAKVLFERNNIVNVNDAGLHLSTAEAIRNALHRPIHYAAGITEKGKVELSALDKLLRLVADVPELKELINAAAKSGKSIDVKIQEMLIGGGKSRPWRDFSVSPSQPHAQYTLEGKEPSFIKKEQAKAIPALSIGEKENIEKMVSTHPLPFGEGTDLGATIKPLEGKPGEWGLTLAEHKAAEKASHDRYLATIKPAQQMTPEDIALAKKALVEWQEETRKLNTIIDQEELLPTKPIDIWLKENPGATRGGYYDSIKEQWEQTAKENATRLRAQQEAFDKSSQYLKTLSDDVIKQLDFLPPDPNNPLWKRIIKEVGSSTIASFNAMRSFKTFLDNSWPNQQRLLLFKSHKANMLAMKNSLIAWKNPTEGLRILDELSHGRAKAMQDKLGIDFWRPIKLQKGQEVWQGIEEFGFTQSEHPIAKAVSRIPFMRRSEIAFAVGTNTHNTVIFDQYIAKVAKINEEIAIGKRVLKPGEAFDTMKALKDLGTMLEHMTGRAQLGRLKALSPAINNGFFSIRNMLGRGLLVKDLLNPNPIVRKEAWKMFAMMAGSINAVAIGGEMMGLWEYDTDPRSATTGQIKIGHTYYNPWGPWSGMLRLTARLVTGEGVSAQGNVYKVNRGEEIGRYARGKEAPGPGILSDFLLKSTFLGEKPEWLSVLQWVERLAPMITVNAYDSFSIEEPIQASINTALSFHGMYVSTYLTDAEKQLAIGEKAGIVKGRTWEEVTAPEKAAIRNLPESRALLETKAESEYKRAQVARQGDYDQSLKNDARLIAFWAGKTPTEGAMSPFDWRKDMNDITMQGVAVSEWRKKMGEFRKKEPKDNTKERALFNYYKRIDALYDKANGFTRDQISENIDLFMSYMLPEHRKYVEKNIHPNATPLKVEYYKDRDAMQSWFDLRNKHEKKFRTDGYQQAQEDMQAFIRTGNRVAQANLSPLYQLAKREEANFERDKVLFLRQNARIDELLIKWGYRTEATNWSVRDKLRDGILAQQFSQELAGAIR